MISMYGEDDFETRRTDAHEENAEVYDLTKEYRAALRGLKCPTHKIGARISSCHQYHKYDDGNYTRIYFTQCCSPAFMAKVHERVENVFPKYKDHRIYESDEI